MALRFVGQWRKGVVWPSSLLLQIIFVCCFDAAICAGSLLIAMIGASMIGTKLFVWLASSHESKTAITMVLVCYLFIAYVFFQRVPYIMITCCGIGLAVLLVNVLFREMEAWIHWFRPKPINEVPSGMEQVASLRSAGDGYNGKFHPVIICDGDQVGDPDHASTLHCFEMRRYSVFWRRIILWRVSVLNGCQRELASFHYLAPPRCLNPFHWCDDHQFHSFQSRGVIFISQFSEHDGSTLTVFDMRFGKSKCYEGFGTQLGSRKKIVLVRLCRRLLDARGRLDGWTIQVLFPRRKVGSEPGSWEVRICNAICDLREIFVVVKSEKKPFGRFAGNDLPSARTFRTNDNSFGLELVSTTQHIAMVFNLTQDRFRYFATVEDMIQAFSQIRYLSAGPLVLNERERVRLLPYGHIFWKAFVPAKMKYIAAKAFFRSNPEPLNRMNAAQFRRITGVKMEGQFPIQPAAQHVWIEFPDIV